MIFFMPFHADRAARAKADTATVPAQFRFRGRKLWALCDLLFLFSAGRAARAKADTATIKAQIRFRSRELWFCFAIFLSSLLFPADCAARAKADTVTIKAQIRFRSRKLWAFLTLFVAFSRRLRGQGKSGQRKGKGALCCRSRKLLGLGDFLFRCHFPQIARPGQSGHGNNSGPIVFKDRKILAVFFFPHYFQQIARTRQTRTQRRHAAATLRQKAISQTISRRLPGQGLGDFLAFRCSAVLPAGGAVRAQTSTAKVPVKLRFRGRKLNGFCFCFCFPHA